MYSTVIVLVKDHAKGHTPDILSPGVFSTEQKAVQALFKFMIEKMLINPICEDCEIHYKDCECDEEKNVETWRDELIDKIKTEEDLDSICDAHGDTYYDQNWFFKVFKQSIDHEQVKFEHVNITIKINDIGNTNLSKITRVVYVYCGGTTVKNYIKVEDDGYLELEIDCKEWDQECKNTLGNDYKPHVWCKKTYQDNMMLLCDTLHDEFDCSAKAIKLIIN